jgi:hypothetical protein
LKGISIQIRIHRNPEYEDGLINQMVYFQ